MTPIWTDNPPTGDSVRIQKLEEQYSVLTSRLDSLQLLVNTSNQSSPVTVSPNITISNQIPEHKNSDNNSINSKNNPRENRRGNSHFNRRNGRNFKSNFELRKSQGNSSSENWRNDAHKQSKNDESPKNNVGSHIETTTVTNLIDLETETDEIDLTSIEETTTSPDQTENQLYSSDLRNIDIENENFSEDFYTAKDQNDQIKPSSNEHDPAIFQPIHEQTNLTSGNHPNIMIEDDQTPSLL